MRLLVSKRQTQETLPNKLKHKLQVKLFNYKFVKCLFIQETTLFKHLFTIYMVKRTFVIRSSICSKHVIKLVGLCYNWCFPGYYKNPLACLLLPSFMWWYSSSTNLLAKALFIFKPTFFPVWKTSVNHSIDINCKSTICICYTLSNFVYLQLQP